MRQIAFTAAFACLILGSCRSAATLPDQPVPRTRPFQSDSPTAPPPRLFLSPTAPPSPAAAPPVYEAEVSPVAAGRLAHSWREGCPVAVGALRLISLSHWGFDGRPRRGELVVRQDHAYEVVGVMRQLYDQRFPIERMELIDKYQGDDDKSMEANNTSAFNCRDVDGRPGVWSEHAFGTAIDINPVQNPYVASNGEVSPRSGMEYADRSLRLPGMIHPGEGVVRAFRSAGWHWGGEWSGAKDYQHFSVSGR